MDPVQIKTSLITYMEPLHGGVPIHIAITLNDSISFESVYWIHPSGARYLEVHQDFLELFELEQIEDFPFLNELMDDIDTILPTKEEIYQEILFTTSTSGTETFEE